MQRKPYSHRKVQVNKGDKYNDLTAIKEVERMNSKRMVLCKCVCGKEVVVRLEYLRVNHTKSCGCRRKREAMKTKKTHGLTKSRLYRIWAGMKARCYNPNRKSYKYYGLLGVKVCDEWQRFESFYEWAINNGYEDNLTIERIDPFGNYEPSNCCWIPFSEQAKNKRNKVGVKNA